MKILLVTAIVLSVIFCRAQDYPFTDSLKQNLTQARTPAEKIIWLGELAAFYRNLNNTLSDAHKKQQLNRYSAKDYFSFCGLFPADRRLK